jgi:UDPglucose 6-dehydrogenase
MYHLGLVTSACLASKNFQVTCLDPDKNIIDNLKKNIFPIYEPNVELYFNNYRDFLNFEHDVSCVLKSDFIWVTFDTPVDDQDIADTDFVMNHIRNVLEIKPNANMIVSSQMPIGSIAQIEKEYPRAIIACSPENLRLGKSIENFIDPDRIIIGTREKAHNEIFKPIFESITSKLIWMQTESAEMVKHTINSFLATCISFSNEISRICEQNHVDILEVEEGFRSESRVGKTLPLRSGLGFAGATLARDVNFLKNNFQHIPLISSIMETNTLQNKWCCGKVQEIFKNKTAKIGVIGLTYKKETSTLRRSTALETCCWLIDHGHKVFAYDEHVNQNSITELILLCDDINEMIKQVDCVIIFSKKIDEHNIETQNLLKDKIVLDPNGFYERFSQNQKYFRVGNCIKEV